MPRGRVRRLRDVRYSSNGLPPYHMRFGPRVRDGQSGFPTYRDLIVNDEWDLPVDPQYGGYDTNDQEGGSDRR